MGRSLRHPAFLMISGATPLTDGPAQPEKWGFDKKLLATGWSIHKAKYHYPHPYFCGGKGCQRRLHLDQSVSGGLSRVDWIWSTGVLNPIVSVWSRDMFHPDHGEKEYVSVLIIQVVSSKLLPTGGNWVNNEGITSCVAMYRAVHWISGWDAQHADPTYNEIFRYPWLWFIVHRGLQNTMRLSLILDLFQSVVHILPE